jgi:hypothetical protein
MINYELPDARATINGTGTIILSILTCWFVDWLRKGRQLQQDLHHHRKQLGLLQQLEISFSKLAQGNGGFGTPLSDDGSCASISKLSKLRLDLDGMIEDCGKLEETHHNEMSQLQLKIEDINGVNRRLERDLQDAQASLKSSQKEIADARAQHTQSGNDDAAKLSTLQSQYDKVVDDLRNMRENAKKAPLEQQSNQLRDDTAAKLEALQIKYDKAVGDLAIAESRAKGTEKSIETGEPETETAAKLKEVQAQYKKAIQGLNDAEFRASEAQVEKITSEAKYNDMLSKLRVYVEDQQSECEKLKRERKEFETKALNLEQGVYSGIEEAIQKRFEETSDRLQSQLGKVEDENKQLVEKASAANKRCLELEIQVKSARASRDNESEGRSPIPADIYRNQLDFERRLSQNEEDIRKVQSNLSPISSVRASPISPSRNRSGLSRLLTDHSRNDNMELYESPPSVSLATRRGSNSRARPIVPRSASRSPSPLFTSPRPTSSHGRVSPSSQSPRALSSPSAFEGRLEMGFEMNKPLGRSPNLSPSQSLRSPSTSRGELRRIDEYEEETY